MGKKAQEEMIGFAMIVIIVAVILLIFVGFMLRSGQKENIESYEVESFIQSFLQYTTNCEDYLGQLSIRRLILSCSRKDICLDGRNSCEVLDSELKGIAEESWKIKGDRPAKGYELKIIEEGQEMIFIKEGNLTGNYKGSMQDFSVGGNSIEISFKTYS